MRTCLTCVVQTMSSKLYKATELAEILNCHPQTIYRMASKGQIESVKVGSLRRFLMPERNEQDNAENRTTS